MYWMWEKFVWGVLNVRICCKRCNEYNKNMQERCWMWKKSVREVLNMRKFINELCWKWENFVADKMKKRKLFKRCTACGEIIRDVLNERKLCKRSAKSET